MSRSETEPTYDPLDPILRADPYPAYRRLREFDPVHYSERFDRWVLTRHADIEGVLRDPRMSSDFGNREGYDPEEAPFGEVLRRLMLFMDPPDHTRLRALVQKAFTRRRVEQLRGRIGEIVDELLDGVRPLGRFDVINDFAYPLPVIVICELLGVPVEDRERFKGWTRPIARLLDPLGNEEMPRDLLDAAGASVGGFMMYFIGLLHERRQRPQDDLLSALATSEEQGDVLTDEEILAMCGLLFIAGHETTMNLIGNGLLALLRNPGELERLRDEPALVRSGVEELLRYDSPVQLTARTVMEEIDVAGQRIGHGQQVVLLLGAANRDPDVFEDPDDLDVGRAENRHLAFGAGHHFCLGAPLARLEAQVAFPALVRLSGLRLAEEPSWRETMTLRGVEQLIVELDAP